MSQGRWLIGLLQIISEGDLSLLSKNWVQKLLLENILHTIHNLGGGLEMLFY